MQLVEAGMIELDAPVQRYLVEGRIEPRELLDLTVLYDDDVIDGAPAARFTQRLVELIESGYGLDEDLHRGGQS